MTRLLITGGAGYIGSILSERALRDGYKVRVADALWFDKNVPSLFSGNPNYEFVMGDIRDEGFLDTILKDIDFIIHAAAVVGEPACNKFPDLARQTNYDASVKLISRSVSYGIKGILFFSTCSNYGISDGLANEESLLRPLSIYAETKVNTEQYLINKAGNIAWVICRLSTAYGLSRRMRFDLTVNDFTLNAYQKKYLDIFMPQSCRPYIHVSDIAEVIMAMLSNFGKIKNNIFNVGFSSENYSKMEIVEMIKEVMPETEVRVVKNGADLRDYRVDFSKLKKTLNVSNKFTPLSGINEILAVLKTGAISDPWNTYYYNINPGLNAKDEKADTVRCS